ncbi:MAG: exopolysaccharide biosynthesis polyprenyl glycosylphosphotransferase [Gaiellaceae bacterium]
MSEIEIRVGGTRRSAEGVGVVANRIETRYGRDAMLRRVLATADVATVAAVALIVLLSGGGLSTTLLLLLSVPAWIVTAKIAGLYDRDHRTLRHLTVDELPWIIGWAFGSTAFLTLLTASFPSFDIGSTDRLIIWAAAIGLGFLFRAAARTIWRRATPPERMLIVGDGPLAEAVVRKLELFPDIHAEVVGEVASCLDLGDQLDELDGVDRIVIACSELSEELLVQLLPACRLRGVKLTVVPPTRGMFGTATHLGHIADLPLLDYNTWDISRVTKSLKRSFDVLVAFVGLLVLSPLLALAALAIVLDSGLPIFFRQTRGGEGGRPFEMIKFRTMVRDAEAMLPELVPLEQLEDPMFKLPNDPRVTRVGRLLRKTSIDEVPQLVNVLRGDMSIVGPRPEQLDLVERYLPEHQFRLAVKPGLTGPMQVYGRGELTFAERLAVEREYIENLSLTRDFRIVLLTLPVVFGRRGAF